MDEAEARATRRAILDDVGALLREHLAADAWGRLLVEMTSGPEGQPIVAGIDVEEIVGDEARVDAVFGGDAVRAMLPVLAKAVEALCALDGVELDEVSGGTFIRREGDAFVWLPGLVRAPSVALDRERDALVGALRAKNEALRERYGFPEGGSLDLDVARGTLSFSGGGGRPGLWARATLIGTFAPPSRTWGWGGTNPHAPEGVRVASRRLVDEIVDRSMWELSTPVFCTDEATAWALAALVCDRARGDGVLCGAEGGGRVFVLLQELQETETSA
jgi:hypothetical protein